MIREMEPFYAVPFFYWKMLLTLGVYEPYNTYNSMYGALNTEEFIFFGYSVLCA